MLDKGLIKSLYKQGYNSKEIAEYLEVNSDSVRQCIHRNCKDDKIIHEINRLRDKEILRVTRRESNSYMSDKDFIKRNRSIYITKENGDIVLNKKVAPVVSFDTPRRLINENKCII